MYKVTESIDRKAREVARGMIENGETIKSLPVHPADSIFVSADKDKLVALSVVIVDGREFYVGHKK